jgi:Myb/SANT-like DNA-binding domain
MEKRIRSRNFVPCEKQVLARILVKYRETLESKITTKVMNRQKEEAWIAIAKEFNAVSKLDIYRSMDQLKTLWENCRKELIEQFQEVASEAHVSASGSKLSTSTPPTLLNGVFPKQCSEVSSPKRVKLEVDLVDICDDFESQLHNDLPEFEFRPIRLTNPANFATTTTNRDSSSDTNAEAKLRMKILEEQQLHQRELQVLEIKLARERIDYERLIAEKKLELLKLKILKEKSNLN